MGQIDHDKEQIFVTETNMTRDRPLPIQKTSEVDSFDQSFKTAAKEIKDQSDKFCKTIRDHPDCLFHDRKWDQSAFGPAHQSDLFGLSCK